MEVSKYPTHLVTTMGPDGVLESHEVVVVPILVSWRVHGIMGIRKLACWFAMGAIWVAEVVVDVTDWWTKKLIPRELWADENITGD